MATMLRMLLRDDYESGVRAVYESPRVLWKPSVKAHCWRCPAKFQGRTSAEAVKKLETHLQARHGHRPGAA